MKRLVLSFILAIFSISNFAQTTSVQSVALNNSSREMAMITNLGQYPDHVRFMAPFAAGYIFMEDQGLTFSMYDKAKMQSLHGTMKPKGDEVIGWHAYKMKLVNSLMPKSEGNDKMNWHCNFALGDDESKWKSNAPVYRSVMYEDVYPGIDLQFASEYNNFKYNVIAEAGADLTQFEWEYEGVESIKLDNGQLVVETSVGPMHEMKPIAWQLDEVGNKIPVRCVYELNDNRVTFGFPEGYSPDLKTVIDPVLVFSTYSGSTADNWGYTATYDQEEYAFGAGIVGGAGYPTTTGVYDDSFNQGGWDVGITKFTQDGTDLVYSTYLGGNDSDLPSSMIVNNSNQLVIIGFTGSNNFPTTNGAFSEQYNGGSSFTPLGGVSFSNGTDIFITRFSEDGSAVLSSTYVGGSSNDGINQNIDNNYGDVFRSEVIVDIANNVYVVSNSTSTNFPVTPGAQQETLSGTQDAVIMKLPQDLSQLDWCTFWGGSGNDSGYSIEVNDDNQVYVAGGTQSSDLALPAGGDESSFQGDTDGYIIRLTDGLVDAGTYVGTSQYDQTFFIELDTFDYLWTTGQTEGSVQITPGVYSNPGAGQFLYKFEPDLSEILISTTYGSDNGGFSAVNICQTAFLVDNCNRIFVSGWGGALNFAFGDTSGMPTTADAYLTTTDGSDFYIVVFEEDASDLLFGSFMGSNILNEHVDGGTSQFSPKGIIYQAVCAGCGSSDSFPTTDGAWSNSNNSTNCNLAVFKYDLEIASLVATATASPSTTGCTPLTVEFSNAGSNGVTDSWEFGNGDSSDESDPVYTYTEQGVYTVTYISTDEETCNISDTSYLLVIVQDPLDLNPSFTYVSDPCQLNPEVVIDYQGSVYDNITFDMGDGGSISQEDFTYTYDGPGNYTITLTITDNFCGGSETIVEDIEVLTAQVNAEISASSTLGCNPLEVSFDSDGSIGINGYWDLGNGNTSTDEEASTTYMEDGEFTITYIIQDPNGPCFDTAEVVITVVEPLDLSPVFVATKPLCSDSLYVFIDYIGSEYDNLVFDMDDGTTLDSENFTHFYDLPGVYNVEVTITDEFCNQEATFAETVEIEEGGGVLGTVHFPNVFSPNVDQVNRYWQPFLIDPSGEKVVPQKTEISTWFSTYELLVYNRWGNLIFEGDRATPFWDGSINGNDAPDGVYYYIITYELSCGDEPETDHSGHMSLFRN